MGDTTNREVVPERNGLYSVVADNGFHTHRVTQREVSTLFIEAEVFEMLARNEKKTG